MEHKKHLLDLLFGHCYTLSEEYPTLIGLSYFIMVVLECFV